MSQCTILHLFGWDKKFVLPFMDFVRQHFSDGNHEFVIYGNVTQNEMLPSKDTLVYPSLLKNFFAISIALHKSEKIILHGLFKNYLYCILATQPWVLRKCYWVIWGGDLYNHINRKKDWRWWRDWLFRKFVIGRLGCLVTYIPGDVELVRKWYGAKGKYVECIMYLSNVFTAPPVKEKKSVLKTILVGNSATPSNNHEFAFRKLAEQDLEGWRIVVPLSYGDKAYADKIIKLGNELFGDRFEFLTDFLPYDDYLQLLRDVDIAVFAHDRQQAMGNTITLLGMGKSIYMRDDTTSWFVLTQIGIHIYDIRQFNLTLLDEDKLRQNKELISRHFSEKNLINGLSRVFYA